MNVNRDPDAIMAAWLDDGPAELPADTRQAIAVGIRTVPRRRPGISWPAVNEAATRTRASRCRRRCGRGSSGAELLRQSTGPGGPVASPSPTSEPTPSPLQSPRPGEATFTSAIHGISIDLPAGWKTRPATEPWAGGPLNFDSPAADVIFDPALGDRLYMVLASQPYGGLSADAWRGVQIDWLCPTPTSAAMGFNEVWSAGFPSFSISCGPTASAHLIFADTRGYLIRLVASRDEPGLADTYDWDWHKPVLRTVDLRPEEALPSVPSPSPTAPRAAADFPEFPGPPRPIEAGTYHLGPEFPVAVSFVVPAGWQSCTNNARLLCLDGGVGEITVDIVNNVVADPCKTTLLEPSVGPTVEDLVTAISSLPWSAVTPPTEVTVDGIRGKEFEVTAPVGSACAGDAFAVWVATTNGRVHEVFPGDRNWLRILDVQGTRVVIAGSYRPGITSSEDLAEINAIIDSVRIEP